MAGRGRNAAGEATVYRTVLYRTAFVTVSFTPRIRLSSAPGCSMYTGIILKCIMKHSCRASTSEQCILSGGDVRRMLSGILLKPTGRFGPNPRFIRPHCSSEGLELIIGQEGLDATFAPFRQRVPVFQRCKQGRMSDSYGMNLLH